MKKKVKIFRFIPLFLLISLVAFFFIDSQFSYTGNVIETASEIAKTTSYIYGNGLVASVDSNGEEKFYINDHLGGTSIVLDENGNKIEEESYYAFGEEKISGDSRFTYTGKEKDDSGLYYYGARYYDADSGRFTQPDPISGSLGNPQSLNKYVYVLNNPNKFVDPSGMEGEVYGSPTPVSINVRNFLENEERLGNEAGGVAGGLAANFANFLKVMLVSTHEEQGQWFKENIESGGIAGISSGLGGFSDDIAKSILRADEAFTSKGGIKRVLFRGDNNVKPAEAFEKGIIAGENKAITSRQHTSGELSGQSYFDDPWKSATTDENVAAFFAGDRGGCYVYYLAETRGRTLNPSKADVGMGDEAEVLFRGTIKPPEIVGARKVINIRYKMGAVDLDDITNIEDVDFGDFIPNPKYKE